MSAIKTAPVAQPGVVPICTGLLGRGILASRSPWMHQQEAAAQSLQLSYKLFDFTDCNWPDEALGQRLSEIEDLGFAGVNVTHPFKQAIIPLLDGLAPLAESVGAVNTVNFKDGQRIGHNTDVTGFADSVREGLPNVTLGRIVQFGAGGAGSATALALCSLGAHELVLVDSDAEKADQLSVRLKRAYPDVHVSTEEARAELLASADGVVNATPMGMAAHPSSPFDPAWLREELWVADIVYFPLETDLLKLARARGCGTLDGRRMAVYQAADAFDIFTGARADRARMLASFDAFPAQSVS